MAITNLTGDHNFASLARSTTSAAGANEDFVTVPAGAFFILLSLRVQHADTVARICEFVVDDGTQQYASPALGNGARVSIAPAPEAMSWTGKLYLPTSWRVGVRISAMAAGKNIAWQATAIQCTTGAVIL